MTNEILRKSELEYHVTQMLNDICVSNFLSINHEKTIFRLTNYKHFDYQTGTGFWVTAVVR